MCGTRPSKRQLVSTLDPLTDRFPDGVKRTGFGSSAPAKCQGNSYTTSGCQGKAKR